MRCTRFFGVCAVYDARNEIVHHGQLPVGQDPPSTWFIGAQLLSKVLAWFAAHPDSDLSDLDAEIWPCRRHPHERTRRARFRHHAPRGRTRRSPQGAALDNIRLGRHPVRPVTGTGCGERRESSSLPRAVPPGSGLSGIVGDRIQATELTRTRVTQPPLSNRSVLIDYCLGEVRVGEVRAGKVRAGQIRAGEVRTGELGAG